MTREKAIKIVKEFINGTCLHLVDQEALETLIPELRESEDERIRRKMIEHFKAKTKETWCNMPVKDIIAYLEKQKEQKSLLPEDKVKHPLYVEGFEAGKEVGRQCENVFGKQEEQKYEENHILEFEKAKAKYEGIVEGKQTVLDNPEDYGLCKPAEWSEEDEKILESLISLIETISEYYISLETRNGYVAWFKSLRPSWKPSEEQMDALRRAVNKLAKTDVADSIRLSIMYDNLKKLM